MKRIYLLLPILAVLAMSSCKKEPVPTSVEFNGSTLYFTPERVAKDLKWSPAYGITGAVSTSDGKANTDSIVAYWGEGNYPAKVCADLVQGGFDDWYLPSIEEFEAISVLGDRLPPDEYTGTYWTSTELSTDQARYGFIHFGSQYNLFKNYEYDCLCVRKD